MEQNFRILYQECSSYPVLKAFVKFLDMFQLVGNQNQVVSPGQDDVYDVFHKICDEVYDDVYDSFHNVRDMMNW